ncbi:hypothetical protein ACNQ2A_01465 [Mycoplasma sp. 1458C]|uniref:hypothetical protein n=1 Tax=Mycoplasma sp. 1458C TaxID=3401661 RepID=UPI003AAFBEFE
MKQRKILNLILSTSTLGIATPLIAISSSTNLIISNELETSKNNLKEYVQSLKFQFGIGGFRNRDIPELEEMINNSQSTDDLEIIKQKIDKFYSYLTKYYLAAQGLAFGDPYYFLMSKSGLNDTTYNKNLWGWIKNIDSSEYFKNSYADNVRRLMATFFYPNAKEAILWDETVHEEQQFKAKLKSWRDILNPLLYKNGNWGSYKNLILPLKNINTKLDTPSKEIDLESYTHVGPITIMFTMYAAMQGNIGGAGHNSYAGWGNKDRIINGVNDYKNLMKDLFDQIGSLDPEIYKRTDFYKNLTSGQKNVLETNVINYFNVVITETKDMKNINTGIHTIRLSREGSGKLQNLLNQIFGPNNGSNPNIQAERARLNTLKAQAAENFSQAKRTNTEALKAIKPLVTADVFDKLSKVAEGLTNAEDLNVNTENINNLKNQYQNIVETFNLYSDKKNEIRYLISSTEKRQAFDSALENFKTTFLSEQNLGKISSIELSQIEELKRSLESAYNALNGEQNQAVAIEAVESKMNNFSPDALATLKDKIKGLNNYEDVEAFVNNSENYNSKANAIINTLNEINEELATEDINKLITDPEEKEKVLETINNAKKIISNDKISSTELTQLVNIADSISSAKEIIDNSKWKMTPEEEELYRQLQEQKELANTLLLNSNIAPKLAQTKAKLEELNNNFEDNTYKANAEKMNELLNQYKQALNEAKNEYLDSQFAKLNKLSLPEELKNTYKEMLNSTPINNLESSNAIIDSASESNKVSDLGYKYLTALKNIKEQPKYKLSSPEVKQKYDEMVDNFSTYLSTLSPSATIEDLNIKRREALNIMRLLGDAEIRQNELNNKIDQLPISELAKNDLKSQINNLNSSSEADEFEKKLENIQNFKANNIDKQINLTNKQKELIINKLALLPNVNNLDPLINESNDLNEIMGQYLEAISNAKNIKQSPQYNEADPELKSKVDELIQLYENENNQNGLTAFDYLDIARNVNDINKSLSNLNGDSNLKESKKRAIEEIEKNQYLSQTYKETLKNKVNDANSSQDVNEIVNLATQLNTLANNLADAKKELDILKSKNIEVLSEDTIQKYNSLLKKYNAEFSGHSLNDNVSIEQLQELQKELAKVRSDIESNINAFETKKQDTLSSLEELTNLTEYQKKNLIDQIQNSNNFNKLANILGLGQNLDSQMLQLKQAYINADNFVTNNEIDYNELQNSDAKNELNDALTKAKVVLSKHDLQDIEQGNISLEAAKALTDSLNENLNQVKKDTIIKNIGKELNKVANNSPVELKSKKADILNKINAALTEEELNTLHQEAKNAVVLEPLYAEIENANKINDKSSELETELKNAVNILTNLQSANTLPENTEVNNEVKKLQNAIKFDNLSVLIKEAEQIKVSSEKLKEQLANSKSIYDNKTDSQYDSTIEALKNAILMNTLNKAIEEAEEENKVLNNLELTNAIQNAINVEPNQLSKQKIDEIAQNLRDLIQETKIKTQAKKNLNSLLNEVNEINPKSEYLTNIIKNSQSIYDDSNATSEQINNAISQLKFTSVLNELIVTNRKSQELVSEDERQEMLKNQISNNDKIISQWTQNINTLNLDNEQNSLQSLKEIIKNNVVKTYNETNTNSLYKYANDLKQSINKPLDESDSLPFYNNFIKNQKLLESQISDVVNAKEFQLDQSTNSSFNKLKEYLNANASYFNMASLINGLNDDQTELSLEYKNAIADAKLIIQQYNDNLIIDSKTNSLDSDYNNILAELKQENLRDKNNQGSNLINQAYKNLKNAQKKNFLGVSLDEASTLVDLLNTDDFIHPLPEDLSIEQRLNNLKVAKENALKIYQNNDLSTKEYNKAAEELNKINLEAKKLLSELKEMMNSLIEQANLVDPASSELTKKIQEAKKTISGVNVRSADIVNSYFLLQREIDKNKLSNAINNLPDEIKKSQSFNEISLNPANDVLADSEATSLDYREALNKLEANMKKEKLFKAYDKIENTSQPMMEKTKQVISESLGLLRDQNNQYSEEDVDFFNEQAYKLEQVLANNNLNNAIKLVEKYNGILSQPLGQIYNQAKELEKTLETNDPIITQDVTDKLLSAYNKNALVNQINDANNLFNKFSLLEGQNDNSITAEMRELISKALESANTALSQNNQDEKYYESAAKALKDAIEEPKNIFKSQLTSLNDLFTNINQSINNNQVKPSEKLKNKIVSLIQNSQNNIIGNDLNYLDVVETVKELQDLIRKNDLQNSYDQGIKVANDLPQFTNEIYNASSKMLHQDNLEQNAIDKQNKLQKLANYVAKVINEKITKLTSLNNAQKALVYKEIKEVLDNSESLEELANANAEIDIIVNKANELNTNMKELNEFADNIDSSLTNKPFSSINFTYADPDKQSAYEQILEKVQKVLNKNDGIVINNNDPMDIATYLSDLKIALNDINGTQNFENIKTKANNELNTYNELLNSNSLFNAPTNLQEKFKEILSQSKEKYEVVNTMQSAVDKIHTDNLEKDLNKLALLANEINKFSKKEHFVLNNKVPQIDNEIAKLNNLSGEAKENIRNSYNNAKTFEEAVKVLEEATKNNNTIENDLNNLRNNLIDKINKAPKISYSEINQLKEQLDQIDPNVADAILSDINKIIFGLEQFMSLNDALNKYKASSIKDKNYPKLLNELQTLINGIHFDINLFNSQDKNAVELLSSKIIKEQKNGQALINIVDSLSDNDFEKFKQSVNELNKQSNNKYADFENIILENKYFDILNTSASSLKSKDINALKNIIQSPAMKNIDNVIRSAIIQDIKVASVSLPWWAYIAIMGTILWLIGITLLFTNKNK